MTRQFWQGVLGAVVVLSAMAVAQADLVLYTVPGTTTELVLQGDVTFNPGRTVTFRHAGMRDEMLYFGLETVKVYKHHSIRQQFNRQLIKAGTEVDEMLEAGLWGLKHGLNREFVQAAEKMLKTDPKFAPALAVLKIKQEIDREIPETPEEEEAFQQIVTHGGLRVARSKHYIMLHDTSRTPAPGHRKSRADERLALLEDVYESFLLLFAANGVELDVPRERLRVVLFSEHQDFLEYSTAIDPSLRGTYGYWDPQRNVCFFYNQETDEANKPLQDKADELEKQADDAKRQRSPQTKDLVRSAKTMALLIRVRQEDGNLKTVSHEATHQLAGNTGLLPRFVSIPRWVHEGLATYFEAPEDATWSGIGAVNKNRLAWYQALAADPLHSNINFVISDQIFDLAVGNSAVIAYGQAWGLTHFLMEKHPEELIAYYRMLAQLPPDVSFSPDLLQELFIKAFSKDRDRLNEDWHDYMGTLRTDLEQMLEEAELKESR